MSFPNLARALGKSLSSLIDWRPDYPRHGAISLAVGVARYPALPERAPTVV